MALEVDLPELDNQILNRVQITHNKLFLMNPDEEITKGDLLSLVDYHRDNIRKMYLRDRDYFEGKHDILKQPKKSLGKPDNRLVVNFPKKAITMFNGFFNGTPVKIDHPDDGVDQVIANWERINNFEDVMMETSKASSIYGRAFFYVYQDEEGQPRVVDADPLNIFLIYDNTLAQNVIYGVHYNKNTDGQTEITLINNEYERRFIVDSSSDEFLTEVSRVLNPYPIVPIIEAPENKERMAMCADIYSIFDELDKAMSEKANDVDYFGDAYLKIINAYMTDEDAKKFGGQLRNHRLAVINGSDQQNADIEFMSKPNADTTQENLIDRLVSYIYQIASVTNMNDEAFAGNPSGVSLKLKYQSMKDMADTKSQKFTKALRNVFRCVFSTASNVKDEAWEDLEFKFVQAIPQNLLEESQALTNLWGKVSNRTALAQMPFIADPDKELELIKEEQSNTSNQTADILKKYMTDQQRNGGDDDDNSKPAEEKN